MIVVVTGGRHYGERPGEFDRLTDALAVLHERHQITCVAHGCAKGADQIAAGWASLMRQPPAPHDIRTMPFRAEWHRMGRAAGPVRNARMIAWALQRQRAGEAVTVLACPGGRGTADCVAAATFYGLTVKTLDDVLAVAS